MIEGEEGMSFTTTKGGTQLQHPITTPTSQKAIHGFLLLTALLFGITIAACWCQRMTRQGQGYHAQLLYVWMRFHQEIWHFIRFLFLEPEQSLQDIDERRGIATVAESTKIL